MEKSFGQLLKEIRRSKSISQRELASTVGVDFSYISKIENDRLPPPAAETIESICQALGIASDILLSYSGKVTDEIKNIITSSPEAVRFMQEVKTRSLSSSDWGKLTTALKKLK